MKKLIYADELIHKLLTAIECGKRNDMPVHELKAVLSDVRRMKAVDAVEVVRCKNCKHRPVNDKDGIPVFKDGMCPCRCDDDPYYGWNPPDNWFCPDGEKKERRRKKNE